MKMQLTLVLLLFLGVGVLARSPDASKAESAEAANELRERYMRSASGESSEVTAQRDPPAKSQEGDVEAVSKEGVPPAKSHGGDLEAVSTEAGKNGSGMSGDSESENSSEAKNKAKSVESGGEDKKRPRGSSEENKGGSKESSQSGGKSKESAEDGGQLNGANTSGTGLRLVISNLSNVLKPLSSMLGLSQISHLPDLVKSYYAGDLPVAIEALLKTIGITTSLQEMQENSPLYKMMESIPLVGTIVKFLTSTLSIPINIIALMFSLVTTIFQHTYDSLPNIL